MLIKPAKALCGFVNLAGIIICSVYAGGDIQYKLTRFNIDQSTLFLAKYDMQSATMEATA